MNSLEHDSIGSATRALVTPIDQRAPIVGLGSDAQGRVTGTLQRRQDEFASVLARSGRTADASMEDRARAAAEDFVASTLVEPILKQLRGTNGAAAPFAPSGGERQFRALADAQLARRIVGSAQFPLVDRVARDLLTAAGQRVEPSRAAQVIHGQTDTRTIDARA